MGSIPTDPTRAAILGGRAVRTEGEVPILRPPARPEAAQAIRTAREYDQAQADDGRATFDGLADHIASDQHDSGSSRDSNISRRRRT